MLLGRRFRPGILVACTMLAVPAAGLAAPQADEFERLSQDFDVAQTTFDSIVTQPDSIPMFSRLISALQRRVVANPTAPDVDLLVRSLTFRARAHFNNGAEQAAADDIRALLNADPNTEVDRILISPRFLEVFDSIYDQMIGFIEFGVSPADAELRVDGMLLEVGVISQPVVAGTHALVLERPGYRAIQEDLEVAAGDNVFVDHQLIRMSAVVRILTRPAGARVSVDGNAMGFTGGTPPPPPPPPISCRAATRQSIRAPSSPRSWWSTTCNLGSTSSKLRSMPTGRCVTTSACRIWPTTGPGSC